MSYTRIASLLCAALCLFGLIGGALAAEVDCDATYCFTPQDFSVDEPRTFDFWKCPQLGFSDSILVVQLLYPSALCNSCKLSVGSRSLIR